MSSPQIRRYLCRRFSAVLLLATSAYAQDRPGNPYPNELKSFKFYQRHLSPLRPYISDKAAVVQLFESDQGKEIPKWRVAVYWVGDYKSNTVKGHLWAHSISGRLSSVEFIPKKRISMLGVHFPLAFSHSFGTVSEINVNCDVYTDDFGLQYWIYSDDSKVARRGDLMRIVYGPSKRLRLEIEGE